MPLSLKSSKYTDPGLNKFKKTNLHFATNPYLLYQDPTWLGFKLLFFFNQPDGRLLSYNEDVPNTAYNYLKTSYDLKVKAVHDKYTPLKNAVSAKAAKDKQALSERMASMGLGNSGSNITAQASIDNQMKNSLNSLTNQEDSEISNLKNDFDYFEILNLQYH